MANATFNDLFKVYPNRNAELRSVARTAYEFGATISQEPSAALSGGMDEHAIVRQRSYIKKVTAQVDALRARPLPDLPGTHPTGFPINMSDPYDWFVEEVGGAHVAMNEQTSLIAEYWMLFATELAKSQSAALAGGLSEFDHKRAINNIGTIEKLLDEMAAQPTIIDLPETSLPGSELGQTRPAAAG